MKYKRKKLLISMLIFFTGFGFNIYFSTNLHFLLTGKTNTLALMIFKICINSMMEDKQHLQLFLYLQGFVLLFAIFYFIANNKPYQSSLRRITPEIYTPVSTGQKQFGSAQWLEEKEKNKSFSSYTLNPINSRIQKLIRSGNEYKEGYVDKSGKEKSDFKNLESVEQSLVAKEYISQGGVVLGKTKGKGRERIYIISDDTHTLCIGATRSGKTRTVVLQTIGTLALSGESMILSDPKGELYQYTYPFLERQGYEVIAIDFKNPLKSQRYNFLQPIIDAVDNDDIAKAIDSAWDLTAQLVGEPKGERIWTDGEASVIASAILAVVYDNKHDKNRKYQNMTNVYYFISNMCKTTNTTMPILRYVKKLSDSHPAKALLAISEVAPGKTRGSFYTAALTTLRLFTNPLINSMTNTSDYNVMDTGSRKRAIFIILPDEKTTYYSLASLFVSQHYEQLVKAADNRGGRLLRRVNFMCEEFGNFVKIPDFSNKLTVGGGRGIRFNLFIQSLAQLDEKYGKDVSKTIKGNCENWIYLQTDELETLEEISKKLGNYTVSTYSLSSSHARYSTPSSSHSVNLTHRALLSVNEIRMISRPYSLITSRNNPTIMYAPDLSKWHFNKMFGLGSEEHNRKIREKREDRRIKRTANINDMDLWGVWIYYMANQDQSDLDMNYEGEKTQYTYGNKKGGEYDE